MQIYSKSVLLTAWLHIKCHSEGHVIHLFVIQVRPSTDVDATVVDPHSWENTRC